MILVFSMAATLWGVGWAMGTPRSARATMVGLLLIGVIAIHIVLPDGHVLRQNTGGEPALWIFIICAAFAIFGYSKLLSVVRSRASGAPAFEYEAPEDAG